MDELYTFMMASAIGAIVTFLLQKYGCSAVVASCLVGLSGALLGHFLDSTHLPIVIFAGSFVGMTSVSFGTIALVGLAGLLAGLIYNYSLDIFAGFGGRLGTIAFISTVIVFYVIDAIKRLTKVKKG